MIVASAAQGAWMWLDKQWRVNVTSAVLRWPSGVIAFDPRGMLFFELVHPDYCQAALDLRDASMFFDTERLLELGWAPRWHRALVRAEKRDRDGSTLLTITAPPGPRRREDEASGVVRTHRPRTNR